MSKILLLGANGLLGSTLSEVLSEHHKLIRQSRSNSRGFNAIANPNDPEQLRKLIAKEKPEVIINTIALTDVDRCQAEPNFAYLTNANIVKNIVHSIDNPCTHLIHISTDHLYTRPGPQKEENVDVLNIYSATKLVGEFFARTHKNSTVLRTNFSGHSASPERRSFSDWVVDSLRMNNPIKLAADIIFNPLSTQSLSQTINSIIKNPKPGVFNVGSVGHISKYDFGIKIAHHLNLETKLITRTIAADLGFLTMRPTDMSMDTSLFEAEYFKLPDINFELHKIAQSHVKT